MINSLLITITAITSLQYYQTPQDPSEAVPDRKRFTLNLANKTN